MKRFCTKCGKELLDGKKCDCQQKNTALPEIKTKFNNLLIKLGFVKTTEEKHTLFENDLNIVPDIICADDGETPIKQYSIANLRSRIKQNYAKGKLQVTNKRILFRAAGFSSKGKILTQQEFSLAEIAGVEIKKTNRISGLNILLTNLLISLTTPLFKETFSNIALKSNKAGLFFAVAFAVVTILPMFFLKKHTWTKLISLSCGFGALIGTSKLSTLNSSSLIFGINLGLSDVLLVVLWLLLIICIVRACIVPDLILTIKATGATEAITVRRKQYATLFKQEIEYSGFGEVLPGEDIDVFTNEIGALIKDIQTFGDGAIDKWKKDN